MSLSWLSITIANGDGMIGLATRPSQWRRNDRFGNKAERLNYDTNQVIDRIQAQEQPIVFN
ncbi:MAG: hypothetical protein AB4042_20585 [Leptolyngbyaceae cyanobacterium]